MKVKQFYNKNQFVITDDKSKKTVFQSYASTIAEIDDTGKLTLFRDWDYSHTTRKHLYLFLQDYHEKTYREIATSSNKREVIKKLIDNKVIKLINI